MSTFRWLLRLAAIVAVAVLAVALAGVGRGGGSNPLHFEPSPFLIHDAMRPKGEYDFSVQLVNGGDEPARIIGSLDVCTSSGCFSGTGLPAAIPARDRGWVTVHITAGLPGECAGNLTFYTDRASQPILTLNLRGTIEDDRSQVGVAHAGNP